MRLLNWFNFSRGKWSFVLSFENNAHRQCYKRHFLPTIEVKDYNVMIDRGNFNSQPIKIDIKTYEYIRKIDLV